LTGYKEPNAVLVVFSNNQQTSDGKFTTNYYMFRRKTRAEQWTGVRLGTEGAKELGLKMFLMDQRFLGY
jgi:Xaa-Pro aminopeptidase